MQQITSLLRSTRFTEKKSGIKMLATYLQDAPVQAEQPEQVAALIGEALSEQSDLVQEQALELLLQHFAKIKFIQAYLLSPLVDLFRTKKAAVRAVVISILAKVLEANAYPALDLIQKFYGTPAKGQKLESTALMDLLQMLCKVFPTHGETKRLYYNLLFNMNALPVRFPDKYITKFQQAVGTHLWGLEHLRKVRQVDVAETGIMFPVEGELLTQFREFVTTLIQASARSPITQETMDNILRKFPPFPLDRCFAPFFFIDVTSVTERHVFADTHEFEIEGILKCLLPVAFSLIGTETATVSPTRLETTVQPSGEFHIHIQIKKMYQNYIPLMFYVDVLGTQVPLLMPFVMPRPGNPTLHADKFTRDEGTIPVPLNTNGGEYLRATCLSCGEQNAFRISEIANPAPLYCRLCGVLMKRPGEMHLI